MQFHYISWTRELLTYYEPYIPFVKGVKWNTWALPQLVGILVIGTVEIHTTQGLWWWNQWQGYSWGSIVMDWLCNTSPNKRTLYGKSKGHIYKQNDTKRVESSALYECECEMWKLRQVKPSKILLWSMSFWANWKNIEMFIVWHRPLGNYAREEHSFYQLTHKSTLAKILGQSTLSPYHFQLVQKGKNEKEFSIFLLFQHGIQVPQTFIATKSSCKRDSI